jgi:hypothetical protein
VKRYGKYGRKVGRIVKRYGQYRRKISWIVKRYGNYGRIVKRKKTERNVDKFHIYESDNAMSF